MHCFIFFVHRNLQGFNEELIIVIFTFQEFSDDQSRLILKENITMLKWEQILILLVMLKISYLIPAASARHLWRCYTAAGTRWAAELMARQERESLARRSWSGHTRGTCNKKWQIIASSIPTPPSLPLLPSPPDITPHWRLYIVVFRAASSTVGRPKYEGQ